MGSLVLIILKLLPNLIIYSKITDPITNEVRNPTNQELGLHTYTDLKTKLSGKTTFLRYAKTWALQQLES